MNLREQLNRQLAAKVPAGWQSAEALAKKEGYSSIDSMRPLIKEAIRAGLLETKQFRVVWGNMVRARPFYRYVKDRRA